MTDIGYLDRPDGVRLAYRQLAGTGPTIVFLPGYMSDMAGGKASATSGATMSCFWLSNAWMAR